MPYTVIFRGRVIPEYRNVTAPAAPTLRYQEPGEDAFGADFTIGVTNSRVEVTCVLNDFAQPDIEKAMARALGFATSVVDLISFKTGWALTVTLEECDYGDGQVAVIGLSERRVAPLCTAYGLESGFEDVCDLVLKDLSLRLALRDLTSSIVGENYPLVGAGRAVEAIRHLIAGRAHAKAGWAVMREKLRVDEAYLRGITNASTKPRHGDRGAVDGAQQLEMLSRAWAVMNRYIEYRKRGGATALSEAEFPELSGDAVRTA